MISGTVKFFNNAKGFGFIQPDDGSKDVFVHISAVERAGLATLSENQKVSFELERGQNGKVSAANLSADLTLGDGHGTSVPVAVHPHRPEGPTWRKKKSSKWKASSTKCCRTPGSAWILENGHAIIAYMSGKMRKHRIRDTGRRQGQLVETDALRPDQGAHHLQAQGRTTGRLAGASPSGHLRASLAKLVPAPGIPGTQPPTSPTRRFPSSSRGVRPRHGP